MSDNLQDMADVEEGKFGFAWPADEVVNQGFTALPFPSGPSTPTSSTTTPFMPLQNAVGLGGPKVKLIGV